MGTPATGVDGAIGSINQSGEDQLKIATAVQAAAAKGAAASGIIGAAQSLSNTAASAAGAVRDGARAS
ncbi:MULTISPECIES: hypothetical protein [Ralstonia]|nr:MULTISPECIES: hypothetical protein [Ralstonia]OCS49911.1 hypothetical protein BEK67_18980 [Ralstonia pickettii]